MKILDKGVDYYFSTIEKFVEDNDYDIETDSSFLIGKTQIIITYEGGGDPVYTLLLTGYNDMYGKIYTVVYVL